MNIPELLESMTEEEERTLRDGLFSGDLSLLDAFMHGWAAAFNWTRLHPACLARILAKEQEDGGEEDTGEMAADLAIAVALLVTRHGHDPRRAPPDELVQEILSLADDEEAAIVDAVRQVTLPAPPPGWDPQ